MFEKITMTGTGLSRSVEKSPNKEKSEFMKWIGDLGNDLDLAKNWELGAEEMARDIASGAESELAKEFWDIIDKGFEAYGMYKDVEVSLTFLTVAKE